jgi:hypothetical protein
MYKEGASINKLIMALNTPTVRKALLNERNIEVISLGGSLSLDNMAQNLSAHQCVIADRRVRQASLAILQGLKTRHLTNL